jgi:hypothetical protein
MAARLSGLGTALRRFALALVLLAPLPGLAQFDHAHTAWTALLKKHVVIADEGRASRVRYAGFAADRSALKAYLGVLSSAGETEYAGWDREQKMAFLINAYNAFTIEKVLTRYPDLRSIRDFGSVFGNPWKDRFIRLLGSQTSLDGIEHGMLRAKGKFDDSRVHFAVNCASVGCPMLREEAYVATRLDAQLEQQARRFLSDHARNRFDASAGRLVVSRIFDWYKEDWTSGIGGIASREQYFSRYATLLTDDPVQQKRIAAQQAAITFDEYDWSLNDARQ